MRTVYLGNTLINDVMLGSQRMDDVIFKEPSASIELPPVTSGLILYLDSTQPASYLGAGLSWYNLVAGQPITASLQANVTFTTGPYLTGSYLQVTGSANGYIEIPGVNFTSSNSTVMCATRYTGDVDNQRMLAGLNNNWLLGNYDNSTENYYAGGFITDGGPNDTNWRIYAGTADIAADQWRFYSNAVENTERLNDGSFGPDGLQVGRQSGGGETSNGQVCFIAVYNRVLSGAEITSNYDALKYKVGL
jgi:hypothetical protein